MRSAFQKNPIWISCFVFGNIESIMALGDNLGTLHILKANASNFTLSKQTRVSKQLITSLTFSHDDTLLLVHRNDDEVSIFFVFRNLFYHNIGTQNFGKWIKKTRT